MTGGGWWWGSAGLILGVDILSFCLRRFHKGCTIVSSIPLRPQYTAPCSHAHPCGFSFRKNNHTRVARSRKINMHPTHTHPRNKQSFETLYHLYNKRDDDRVRSRSSSSPRIPATFKYRYSS